jgi:hypothetical protein
MTAFHSSISAMVIEPARHRCVGIFRKVSAKHLPLYVNEFDLRYENRHNADIFGAPIRAC